MITEMTFADKLQVYLLRQSGEKRFPAFKIKFGFMYKEFFLFSKFFWFLVMG